MDFYVFSLVLDRLPLPELLRVASVCMGRRFPWLVFSRGPEVPEDQKMIYDPMRKNYYAVPLPDPDLFFCGVMLGWMFLVRRGVDLTEMIMLNPFSQRQIVVAIACQMPNPMVILTRPPTDNKSILFVWSTQIFFIKNIADDPYFLMRAKRNSLTALPVLVGETVSTNAGVDGGYSGGEKMIVIDLTARKVTNNVMTFSAKMQLPHRVFFAQNGQDICFY